LRAALWHDLVDTNPAQMHAELDHLLEVLKADIHTARRAIFALRPIALDELGFVPAVRQFIDEVCQWYEVCPELRVAGPAERLPAALELPLFRVLQESLNNIGKHAQADNVWIDLDLESTHAVSLTVRDDGVGFDPSTTTRGVREGHMGLRHIRERVETINGSLLVRSRPGQGTEIRVTLPITET